MKLHFRYFFLFILFVVVAASVCLKLFGSTWTPISSDGWGYYAYLPSIFHNADITGNNLVQNLPEEWRDESVGRMLPQANGNYLNKYPIGVALLEAPGYIIAHTVNNVFYQGSYDQYAGPYQVSVLVSGIIALFVGFFFLWKVLIKRFTEKVTYFTLGLIFLGTNILHYTTYDVSFSHVFSFALFGYFLYLIDEFTLDRKQIRYYLRLGIVFGLIVTVRQTNVITGLLFLIPLFKLYRNFGLEMFKKYGVQILVFLISSFLVFFIQMLYWKLVTGNWLVFSYQGEYFDFTHPEIFNVLFSFRKGLFLWTPILLLTIPGIYLMFKKDEERFKYTLPVILILQVYVVASWWAWSFGFAYGHRAFTEFLIFFGIPLAYFVKYLFHQNRMIVYLSFVVFGLLILLNLNFMQKYWRGVLSPDGMTREKYEKVFLKLCVEDIPTQGCEAIR